MISSQGAYAQHRFRVKQAVRHISGARQIWASLLFPLAYASNYLELPVSLTEQIYIPSFSTFIILLIAAALARPAWRRRDVTALLFLIAIFAATAVFGGDASQTGQRFKGLLQASVSAAGGIMLLRLIELIPARRLSAIFSVYTLVLVGGAALEVAGLLGISNDFRNSVYKVGGYAAYSADDRDLALGSFIRPKFFASEPSLLALGYFVAVNCWLMLRPSTRRFTIVGALTFLMAVIANSPIIYLSGALSIAIWTRSRSSGGIAILYVLTGVVLLATAITPALPSLEGRFGALLSDETNYSVTSENLRLKFPFISVVDTLKHYPLFGLGIGGKRTLEYISSIGLGWEYAFGNNNVATLLMYFGLLGTPLFILVLHRYFGWLRVDRTLLWIAIIFISLASGGFEAPRNWGYIFIIAGTLRARNATLMTKTRNVAAPAGDKL